MAASTQEPAPNEAPRAWTKLGLIAGGGALPGHVAEAAIAGGRGVHVIAIKSFAEAPQIARFPHRWAAIGEIGAMIASFREEGCDAVAFAGLVKRPDLASLKVDMAGAALLPKVIAAAREGDDALLRVIVGAFEKAGFLILGADEAAAGLSAPEGPLGAHAPGEAHSLDIERGFAVARALGVFDVGQAAVVCDGLVLAVEGQEGTDAMLARVAGLPEEVRGAPDARRGVLIKAPKPIQDRRIDLPVIGVATVEGAARAGLAGIAVEAGGALIVDRDAVARAADAAGLFVVGVAPGAPPPA